MPERSKQVRGFLSYARGDDGEPHDPATSLVTKLYAELTEAGLDVGFDGVLMPPGNSRVSVDYAMLVLPMIACCALSGRRQPRSLRDEYRKPPMLGHVLCALISWGRIKPIPAGGRTVRVVISSSSSDMQAERGRLVWSVSNVGEKQLEEPVYGTP